MPRKPRYIGRRLTAPAPMLWMAAALIIVTAALARASEISLAWGFGFVAFGLLVSGVCRVSDYPMWYEPKE